MDEKGLTFLGLPVRVSELAVQKQKRTETVRRTWAERFLSWPWRPWQSTRQVEVTYDVPGIYLVDEIGYVAHPVVFNELKSTVQGEVQDR